MRELLLLRELGRSYRRLGLRYSRVATVFVLMALSGILEMSGLSILYPLVLALGTGHSETLARFLAFLPFSPSLITDPRVQLQVILVGVAVLYVAKNVVLYISHDNDIKFAMYYYRELIRALYSAHVHRSVLNFRQESSGALANMICVQSERLVHGVVRPLLIGITESFLLLSMLTVIFFVSPWVMLLVVVACGASASGYYALFRQKALGWGKQRMRAASVLHELVNNTSLGINEIKVFGKEDYLTSKVYSAAVSETEMFHHYEMYLQSPRFLIEGVFVVTFASSFLVAIATGTDSTVLLAKFSIIAASSFRILPCVNRLVGSYYNVSFSIGPALALLETVAELDLRPKAMTTRDVGQTAGPARAGQLELRSIVLAYPGTNRPVLMDVNLIIKAGERVGISGATGSGKSTLIEILAGLYTPTRGSVLVDGRSISEEPKSWQAAIGYVPQSPFIMPGTIRENVTFGAVETGADDKVWRVLDRVGLSTFIASLPEGIGTEVGEKGAGLSGGQKQLVCVARALFRDPHVLLLDEPTAALDGESEEMVLKAIRSLPTETTVIMVSHKQQNFQGFDATYDCNGGRLRPRAIADASNDGEGDDPRERCER